MGEGEKITFEIELKRVEGRGEGYEEGRGRDRGFYFTQIIIKLYVFVLIKSILNTLG